MAIEMPTLSRCAFCDYLSGKRPYTILLTTDLSAVLVTREQRGVGHVLVLPLAHRPTILDVTDEEAADLAITVKRMAMAIDAAYARPGIAVWQNNGTPANQSVSHVHFHVAGTVKGGGTDWGDVEELPLSETDAIAEVLKSHQVLQG
jgi:histidine triad (HIT) family protein